MSVSPAQMSVSSARRRIRAPVAAAIGVGVLVVLAAGAYLYDHSRRDLIANGAHVLITVDLRQDGEALRITAQDAASLDQAAADASAAMRIWLRETSSVPHIRDLLGREGRGAPLGLIPHRQIGVHQPLGERPGIGKQ